MFRTASVCRSGSPPRVWGQPGLRADLTGANRFTPTRVGTTSANRRKKDFLSVHPHACGDNADLASTLTVVPGSPPRVWGQLRRPPVLRSVLRFTPTRVGTTVAVFARHAVPPVPPHACGDNGFASDLTDQLTGSPPRVWGQLVGSLGDALGPRFTPTRVGTT